MKDRYLLQGVQHDIQALQEIYQSQVATHLISWNREEPVYLLRTQHAKVGVSIFKAAEELGLSLSRDQRLAIPLGTSLPERSECALAQPQRFDQVRDQIAPKGLRTYLDNLSTPWPRIAVIDTGFQWSNHFTGVEVEFAACHAESCQLSTITAHDNLGHGTRCIGLICARPTGSGQSKYGLGIDAKILAIKALNVSPVDGSFKSEVWLSSVLSALYEIEKRVDEATKTGNDTRVNIISASWGTYELCHKNKSIFKSAIRDLSKKGVLFVVAAGNDDVNIGEYKYYPAIWSDEKDLAIITVGGSDWTSTNEGYRVTIEAPANDVRVLCTGLTHQTGEPPCYRSGTSYATALEAGIAAMVMKRCPGLTGMELRNFIVQHFKGNKKTLTIPELVTWQHGDFCKS